MICISLSLSLCWNGWIKLLGLGTLLLLLLLPTLSFSINKSYTLVLRLPISQIALFLFFSTKNCFFFISVLLGLAFFLLLQGVSDWLSDRFVIDPKRSVSYSYPKSSTFLEVCFFLRLLVGLQLFVKSLFLWVFWVWFWVGVGLQDLGEYSFFSRLDQKGFWIRR